MKQNTQQSKQPSNFATTSDAFALFKKAMPKATDKEISKMMAEFLEKNPKALLIKAPDGTTITGGVKLVDHIKKSFVAKSQV